MLDNFAGMRYFTNFDAFECDILQFFGNVLMQAY